MQSIDLKSKKKVYFIGIGGISMSAIAVILKDNGFLVSGSDISENEEVVKLKKQGICVNLGHNRENIKDDIDIVVYSKAIHEDNEEMIIAKEKNIKLMSRSEILGALMANYKKRICIAGTHGKTTTTSIISKTMLDKNVDPTINIGGIVDEIGGNVHIGKNKNIFIAESCEYTNSFLDFAPTDIIVTNVDADHLDFFKDIDDIRKSFKKFIELLPDNGLLVINNNITNKEYFYEEKNIRVVTYGDNEDADYYYKNIVYDKDHNMSFEIYHKKEKIGTMSQKLIGTHNASNFAAAFAMLCENGFTFEDIKKSIADFQGAKRRLEIKEAINGISFIDDYAHHPSEIEASIKAISSLKYEHLYLIFQPHTYTRTKALLADFGRVLAMPEQVILAKIYAAREKDLGIISLKDVKDEIIKHQVNKNNIPEYFEKFDDIIEYVAKHASEKDLVITMGAGDVYKIYDMFKERYYNKNNMHE